MALYTILLKGTSSILRMNPFLEWHYWISEENIYFIKIKTVSNIYFIKKYFIKNKFYGKIYFIKINFMEK